MARPKSMKTMFVIAKGNRDVEGNMVKMNALNVVVKFIQKALPKTIVMSDDNTMVVIFPDNNEGNAGWMQENVFKYVDIMGTTGENDAEIKAKRVYDKYETLSHKDDKGNEMLGSSTLMHYLRQFYLIEKAASVFEVPK